MCVAQLSNRTRWSLSSKAIGVISVFLFWLHSPSQRNFDETDRDRPARETVLYMAGRSQIRSNIEMPSITYKTHEGVTREVDVPVGTSVMQGAIKNGVDGIIAECGGNCMCATCHVYVDPPWVTKLEPIGDTEDAMLESTAAERLPNSRLSCQIKVTAALNGLVVTTPDSQY